MRRLTHLWVTALMILAFGVRVDAQVSTGFEALTVSTSAVSITATVYRPAAGGIQANNCFFVVDDADIRYRVDGTAPTASVGTPALQNSTVPLNADSIALFQAIRSGGVDAILQVSCFTGDPGSGLPIPVPTEVLSTISGAVAAELADVTATSEELNTIDGYTGTTAELNQLSTTGSANSKAAVAEGCTFTEDATNATHTCTVTIPANSWIVDIYVTTSVLWTDAETSLSVGDVDSAIGWFNDVDLAATDLLVGEQLSITDDASWGGAEGTYLVAATGVRGQAVAAYASRLVVAASEVIGVVTMTTPSGTAGRTHMIVVYTSLTLVAATAAP